MLVVNEKSEESSWKKIQTLKKLLNRISNYIQMLIIFYYDVFFRKLLLW